MDYVWEPLGNYDLTGPHLHGWSLALNRDGSVLAVGSILSNGPYGNANKSGMVTIYQWDEQQSMDNASSASSSTQWQTTQLHGLEAGDECGYSVSLDGSGTVLGE